MKKVSGFFFAAVALVATSAMAFPTAPEVSPTIVNLTVVGVEQQGKVLKRNKMFPIETITVGIPVTVAVPNACTAFVGQQTINPISRPVGMPVPIGIVAPRPPVVGMPIFPGSRITTLEVKGSKNPLVDACIEIAVAPLHTNLTLVFNVRNETVPQLAEQKKLVSIGGRQYTVTLNLLTEEVTIKTVGGADEEN